MHFTIPIPISYGMRNSIKFFNSRSESMNQWLRHWSLYNQEEGFSKTYASFCLETGVLAGYYSLSSFAIATTDVLPEHLQPSCPGTIPCLLLGRLAVDQAFERRGLGRALIANAIKKAFQASEILGIWGLVVHPLKPSLISFYSSLHFQISPSDNQLMMYYRLSEDHLID